MTYPIYAASIVMRFGEPPAASHQRVTFFSFRPIPESGDAIDALGGEEPFCFVEVALPSRLVAPGELSVSGLAHTLNARDVMVRAVGEDQAFRVVPEREGAHVA